MFAIVQINGLQYRVAEGDTIVVNRLPNEKGKDVSLEEILLFSNGTDVRVGQPFLKDVKIKAKVLDHTQGDRVLAFKFKKRKHNQRIRGHRQDLTSLNITKIYV